MLVDTSIYSNLLRPAQSPMDYANQYAQADANKLNLLMSRAKVDEYQRGVQQKNALMGVYASGKTGDDLANAVLKAGDLDGYSKLRKDTREATKLESETASNQSLTRQRDVQTQRHLYEYGVQQLQGAPDGATAMRILQQGVGNGAWGMQEAQASIEALKQAAQSGNPQAMLDWKQNQLRTILAPKDNLPTVQTRNTGGTTDTLAIDPVTGQARVTGSVKNTASPSDIMTDARVRAEGAAGRAVTMRGQNMTDARSRELAEITRDTAVARRAEAADEKKVGNVDKAVVKFSDTLQKEGIPELETAISQAEGAIGRYPKGQVPGVGPLKNVLPQAWMSDEGKDVRQSLAQVRNIVLSARSGAAVTDQELRRLVEEIGTGAGMSEDDMRKGLKKVRDRIDHIKTNAAAGVSDDVLNTYRDRGGLDIKRGGQAPAGGPKPGVVENGYRFKGGNPADRNSWEKV